MPQFGQRSLDVLATLDSRLQLVVGDAIATVPKAQDFALIEGFRDEATQNEYFEREVSKLKWPNSYHNNYPSLAVDLIPYPTGFDDIGKFYEVATYIFNSAQKYNVVLEWGGHWQRFPDFAHWQIKD